MFNEVEEFLLPYTATLQNEPQTECQCAEVFPWARRVPARKALTLVGVVLCIA